MRELLDEGVVMTGALSSALPGGRLVSVQDLSSPAFRSSRGELEHCAKLGLAFLPLRPLGDIANAMGLAERHRAIQQAADETGTGVHRVTHARELAPVAVPTPGASRSASNRDSKRSSHSERVT
ncbi:hypothetical protein [Streptomyces sp. SLBN-8D4]|uniref:hypothetical protein n=1 Tax=Streptomyces sp. SLBN-8D4 TaxID=3377728 RepID=UPI003C7AAC0F